MRKVVISSALLATLCLLFVLLGSLSFAQGADGSGGAVIHSGALSSKSSGGLTSGSSSSSATTATQPRQSTASAAASLIGALGSLVPGLITNVAPLVLLFGLGALMMPSLGMSAMGLLRESRRSASDQSMPNVALPSAFAQYARPLQTSPQDIYYFTKRSFPSLVSGFNAQGFVRGMQDVLERVAKAIDNADKRYY